MSNRLDTILDDIRKNVFLSANGSNVPNLHNLVVIATNNIITNQGNGPLFPTTSTKTISEITSNGTIPNEYNFNHELNLKDFGNYMQRAVKANSPLMLKNLIPQPSNIYLATYLASSLYMGNAVTGEDAGEALKTEIACSSAISKLAGLDPEKSAGVFTFGGTATNLYAIKIALSKVYPNHSTEGISNNDVVVVGNRASHYCQQTAVNWLGIGQNNYIQVDTNIDQTTNIVHLKSVCRELLSNGKKIACIEAVGGTTSHMGIDDLEEFYNIRNDLVKEFNLNYVPHIHCDSVQGWVWLNFVNYNFQKNILKIEESILEKAKINSRKISKLNLADSFGVDFHKSGFMPYNSSMIILKNKDDFNLLKRKKDLMTPLFHDDKEYNPGVFTIETSRSTANILASWITLQSFGQEGYQALLTHALMIRNLFVKSQNRFSEVGMVFENPSGTSVDAYLRCIKSGPDPINEHKRELDDDLIANENSKHTSDFYEWYNSDRNSNRHIAFSKSTASLYNHNQLPLVALRFYFLSANITESNISFIVDNLITAKKEFDRATR